MFDLKFLRDQPDVFDAALGRRGLAPVAADLVALDQRHRAAMAAVQDAQARRNELSKAIGKAKAAGEDAADLIADVGKLKEDIQSGEAEERELAARLNAGLAELPNLPHESVPDGADEADNRLVRQWGEPAGFDFEPRQHFELGEALDQMDFERAAKLSGARFVVLSGGVARLHRALGQFMIDLHTAEHGYGEVITPILVREQALFGTGQLPKFADDQFRTTGEHWLIPTAEVTLSNLRAGEIVEEEALPLRFAALTQCFRAEAGAAGKDTRGMIRQHEFAKVELVSLTTPEVALDELERKTACAEEVLKRLELPYRVMELCTGDLGFSAAKTYDLEVWLPGQRQYREISSCSVCGDFQARRMRLRCRPRGEKATRFVHTLNGSGVAVGRALVAVLETYQQADGSVAVPEALKPYMGGLDRIAAPQ